jgi:hypothetical protein
VIHFCLNVGRHGFAKLHFKKKLLTIAFKRLYPFPCLAFSHFLPPFLFCPTTPRLRPCLGVVWFVFYGFVFGGAARWFFARFFNGFLSGFWRFLFRFRVSGQVVFGLA